MDSIRRLPLGAAVELALASTVFLVACGSSSVPALARIGGPGRWAALLVLAGIACVAAAASGQRPRRMPVAWLLAAAFLAVGAVSATWSINPRLTVGRIFTLGVLFAAGVALALGAPDPDAAAARVLRGLLAGIVAVAVGGLVLLAVSHDDAVLAATAGAGWRFHGLGQNPNTVPMLLTAGLSIAVWAVLDSRTRSRWIGAGIVLLFAGELAISGSRGADAASFAGAILTAAVLGQTARAKILAVTTLVVLAVACVLTSRLQPPASAAPSSGTPSAPGSGSRAPVTTRGIDAQQVLRLEDDIGHPPLGTYRPAVPRTLLGSSGRAQAWVGAAGQGAQRPLLGYGFGTEDKVFVDRFYAFEGGFPENTYLGVFLQLGAAGIALLAGLLLALGWSAVRLLRGRTRNGEAGPAGALAGVLLAAVVIGMTQSGLVSVGNIAASSIWVCALALPMLAMEARRS